MMPMRSDSWTAACWPARAAQSLAHAGADRADAAMTRSSRCCPPSPATAPRSAGCASSSRAARTIRRSRWPPRGATSTRRTSSAIRASPAWRWPRSHAWPDAATAPDDVLLMHATRAAVPARVRRLGAEPATPAGAARARARPQAWLTLATVRRVQGRYAESDAACRRSRRPAPSLHAAPAWPRTRRCAASRQRARERFDRLLADPRLPPATAGLAHDQRWPNSSSAPATPPPPTRPTEARSKLDPDTYTTLAYADFLIEQRRAGRGAGAAEGPAAHRRGAAAPGDRRHAREGAAAAARRRRDARAHRAGQRAARGASVFHGREQAMFALVGRARRRSARSRSRAATSRSSASRSTCWCWRRRRGRAASRAALRGGAARCNEIGLHDRRIDALL